MEPAGDPGHNGGQAVVGGRRVGQRNGRGQAPLLRGGRGPRLRGVGERGRGQAPLLRGGRGLLPDPNPRVPKYFRVNV